MAVQMIARVSRACYSRIVSQAPSRGEHSSCSLRFLFGIGVLMHDIPKHCVGWRASMPLLLEWPEWHVKYEQCLEYIFSMIRRPVVRAGGATAKRLFILLATFRTLPHDISSKSIVLHSARAPHLRLHPSWVPAALACSTYASAHPTGACTSKSSNRSSL